ncbi:hypothetical protein FNV43_RR00071 [Rhamnella rubrinervis]|uniref:Uncharacterized protein n=1 Tax=Rhamnella rubrinervis TaxID=2594499 RepID=A0A8K0HPX4_9ROSA|nr:hypothetical protein FNV43_RR00071 [Rhamnella rubrinervis]
MADGEASQPSHYDDHVMAHIDSRFTHLEYIIECKFAVLSQEVLTMLETIRVELNQSSSPSPQAQRDREGPVPPPPLGFCLVRSSAAYSEKKGQKASPYLGQNEAATMEDVSTTRL